MDGTVTLNFTLEASGRRESFMFSQIVAQLNVIKLYGALNYMSFQLLAIYVEEREVLIHSKYRGVSENSAISI